MKTITINLYSFNELSEAGKQKAIESCALFNVDYKWFESTFEDAKEIGLKIEEVELDRGLWAKGEFTLSAHEVAVNIIRDHGEECGTFKTAQTFLDNVNSIEATEGEEYGEGEEYESKMMDFEEEFKNSLLGDYAILLRDEYEYQTSKEAILETIEFNEYTFEADGTLNNG